MFLMLLGAYVGASAVYWGVKYYNTKDEKKREAARKDVIKSYGECLKWPADLLNGVTGFGDEEPKDNSDKDESGKDAK